MNPTIEYYERSRNGKRMESAEFDDLLMDTAMDLVDEYDLDFDLVLRLVAAGEKIESEHAGGQVTLLDQLPEKSYDLATHKPRSEFVEAAECVAEILEDSGVSLGGLSLD